MFPTIEKMPPWLSGLIQNKDETPQMLTHSIDVPTKLDEETRMTDVEKTDVNEHKIAEENSSLSILSLLREKNNLQSAELELIHKYAKKKQNIQQAAITLLQDQQNNDLLIKVINKLN